MRKSAPSKRSDEQLIAAINARLDYKPATRTAIQESVQIGHEQATRLLGIMLENEEIEMYRGKAGTHVCDLYCIAGIRPSPLAASSLGTWAKTLAGFREAVQGAANAGRDPFKVAA